MWFTLYLHIKVEWIGTRTPSPAWFAHPGSEARAMCRFNESFETIEEHRYYDQRDADLTKRQTENIYGPRAKVEAVSETKYREIESKICSACVELEKLEELFV